MSSVPAQFNAYDTLGHLCPGAIAMLLVLPLLPGHMRDSLSEQSGILVGVAGAVAAYCVGILLSGLGSYIDRALNWKFGWPSEVLLRQAKYSAPLRQWAESRLRSNQELLSSSFGLFDFAWVCVSESARSDRPVRFYATGMLLRGLGIVLWLAAVSYGVVALSSDCSQLWAILAGACLIGGLLAMLRYRRCMHHFAKDVVLRAIVIGRSDEVSEAAR